MIIATKFLKKLFSQEEVIEALSRELFGGPEWPLTDTDALDDEALRRLGSVCPS